MRGSRFVFLAVASSGEPGSSGGGVLWVLVSPNNRRLGQAGEFAPTYQRSLAEVTLLRGRYSDLTAATGTAESSGRWTWRVDLDGVVVARCTRPYLRQQECGYNLQRFLAAVPQAVATTVMRTARIGRIPEPRRQ